MNINIIKNNYYIIICTVYWYHTSLALHVLNMYMFTHYTAILRPIILDFLCQQFIAFAPLKFRVNLYNASILIVAFCALFLFTRMTAPTSTATTITTSITTPVTDRAAVSTVEPMYVPKSMYAHEVWSKEDYKFDCKHCSKSWTMLKCVYGNSVSENMHAETV